MKNLKFILVALFALALTATSCKKEEAPQPQVATPPAETYGTYTFDIGAADLLSTTATFNGAVIAKTQCRGELLDSTAQLPVTFFNSSITLSDYDPCSTLTTAYQTQTTTQTLKVVNGEINYLEIYDLTGLLVRYEILSSGSLSVIFKSTGTNTYGKLPCGIVVPYR